MLFQKTFKFENWDLWAQTIHQGSLSFFQSFSLYPNLMVAHPATYSKINEAANKDKKEGEEYVGILGFNGKDYKIEFLVDEQLPEAFFHLLYDKQA